MCGRMCSGRQQQIWRVRRRQEYWRRCPAPGPSPSPRVRRGGIHREDCCPACTEVSGVGEEVSLERYAPRAPLLCLQVNSRRTCERRGRSGCSAQLPCAGGHRQGKEEAANQSQTCVGSHESVFEGVRMRFPRHRRCLRGRLPAGRKCPLQGSSPAAGLQRRRSAPRSHGRQRPGQRAPRGAPAAAPPLARRPPGDRPRSRLGSCQVTTPARRHSAGVRPVPCRVNCCRIQGYTSNEEWRGKGDHSPRGRPRRNTRT